VPGRRVTFVLAPANKSPETDMKNFLAIFFAAAMTITVPAFAQEKMTQDKMDKMDSKETKSTKKMKKTDKMDKMDKMDKTDKMKSTDKMEKDKMDKN
jgi:hypothetical protein